MAVYNYELSNFISTPSSTDINIKIYDKNGVLKYTFNPDLSYYFYKNNFVIIKVDNADDITLDFVDTSTAMLALENLNDAKKIIVQQANESIEYYTKTEFANGVLDNRYYTQTAITNAFAPLIHTHYFSGLTGLEFTGLTNGQVLTYNNGIWTNSAFTFDTSAFTSNYYTINDLSSASTAEVHWLNIVGTPTGITAIGISDVYTKTEIDNNFLSATTTISDLDGYTKTWIDSHFYTQNYLDGKFLGYSVTSHTHELSSLSDVPTVILDGQYLVYTGGTWEAFSAPDVTNFFTKTEVGNILLGYSTTAHTHNFTDLSNTAHTHDWSNISNVPTSLSGLGIIDVYTKTDIDVLLTASTFDYTQITNTAHTHDDRYYTKSELTGGTLDNRYYTETELNNGVLDSRYTTTTWINSHYYTQSYIDNNVYTSAQTLVVINNILTGYTTTYELGNALSGYSLTSHTHTYNLNDINDVSVSPSEGDYLIYNGGQWVNSAITGLDLSDYYTKSQTENLFIPLTGSSNISGSLIPSVSGLTLGSISKPWEELYVSNSTIYIGNVPVSINGNGELVISGSTVAIKEDVAPTAHTHDDRYYTETELNNGVLDSRYYSHDWINAHYYTQAYIDTLLFTSAQTINILSSYYTSGETDILLSTKSDTGHTHNLSGLTDVVITSLTNGQSLIYSGGSWINGTVDLSDFYYTKSELSGGTLDSRYYTETELDNGQLDNRYYTETEVDNILDKYYTSAQTDTIISDFSNNYYTSGETDTLLSTKSDTGHTHDSRYYTQAFVQSHYYTQAYIDSLFYNTGATYSKIEINDLIGTHTGNTNNPHETSFDNLTSTAHTHDDRYYTELELLPVSQTQGASVLDDRFYTQTWIDAHFYNKSQIDALIFSGITSGITVGLDGYWNSAQTISYLGSNYYTETETDNLLTNYSTTAHTHSLSGLTDVVLSGLTDGHALVYSAGTWYNEMVDTMYQNSDTMPVALGGWPAGTDFETPMPITEVLDGLLYPELNPTLTNPSSTFTMSPSGLREIGEVITTISFSSTFNRGTISPAYGTSGYRSGLPNTYNYVGTDLSNNSSTSLTDSQSVTNYEVSIGAQSWTGSVSYDVGEQPLTNKGNDYSSPLPAGTTSTITRTITGVYPAFATTSNITTFTKQTLVTHGSYIVTNLVAESGSDKQKVDIPNDGWSISILQQYNTLSGSWESIDLSTFTSSSITRNIQGYIVNYTRYTHNGSLIGARQLRWK